MDVSGSNSRSSLYIYVEIVRAWQIGKKGAGFMPSGTPSRSAIANGAIRLVCEQQLSLRACCLWFRRSAAPTAGARRALNSRQHDVGGLIECPAKHRIARLRYMSTHISLARLDSARDQAGIGADIFTSRKSAGILNTGSEREGGDRTNARNAHQASTGRISVGTILQQAVGGAQLLLDYLHCCDERSK